MIITMYAITVIIMSCATRSNGTEFHKSVNNATRIFESYLSHDERTIFPHRDGD
jgi:hypothetical protein